MVFWRRSRQERLLEEISANTGQIARSGSGWRYWLPVLIGAGALCIGLLTYVVTRETRDLSRDTLTEVQRLNANYAADLIERGPFDEDFARIDGLEVIDIVSTTDRLSVAAINVVFLEFNQAGNYAQVDVYDDQEDAAERYVAAIDELMTRYDGRLLDPEQPEQGDRLCGLGTFQGGGEGWYCAGVVRNAFVLVQRVPGSNADRAVADSILKAVSDYADSMQRLATS